jgi:hypothetical protein
MQKSIDFQSQKLQKGVSNQQYLVFKPVTKADLAKMDTQRHQIGKHTRMTHYADDDLLIIKLMPSGKHECAHLYFGQKFLVKVIRMGTSDRELRPMGGTRYPGNTSSKEGDTSYKPSSREKESDWPTIVIESGLSESFERLRGDASWWLQNSKGEVKIVIIISVKPVSKRLEIEKWELAPRDDERRNTRSHPSSIPTKIQEFTIMPDGSVTGALPLVLEFQKIFLRPAIPPECDITFSEEDLSVWADDFWKSVK